MADYAMLSEVYPLISRLGTLRDAGAGVTATQPSATQAGALCTLVTNEVNAHLRAKGYALPVTDADALLTLKAIAQSGAAARILRSAFTGIGSDAGGAEAHEARYAEGLALIDSGGLAADMTADESAETISYDFTRPYDVMGSAYNGETDSPF